MLQRLRIRLRRRSAMRRGRGSAGNGAYSRLRRPIIVMCFFGFFVILAVWFQSGLRPIVEQIALQRVKYLAGQVINDAVNAQVASDGAGYEFFIGLEKDSAGKITALKTDMVAINRFKAEVTANVLEHISQLDTTQVNIPIGNIIGGELFSGRGPKIPIKVVPVGSANAEFSSELKTAGINQTRHQIVVTVTADISILLPGFSVGTAVSTQVIVAETIVVGEVPNTYGVLDMGG